MRRCLRALTLAANAAACGLVLGLDRLSGPLLRRRPADYRIDLEVLYRMEAHWALTFARLGTIWLPPARLHQLGTCLDTRSYLQVLWRFRREVAASTVSVIEAAALAPADQRSLRVSDDYYGRSVGAGATFYPYVMHPWVYAHGQHRRVVALRRTPRRVRLFFSGVVNDGYRDRFDFPIMARPAILDYVRETFRSDACVVASRADLPALRRTDRPIVLILFRGDITPTASNHFLSRASYFRWLARAEFALCPPGVFMPHSHNLIEALAVGTIPVTNYPTFARPPLTDGQTCLAFATPDELGRAVRRTLTLPDPVIQAMRGAVTQTYDDDLSPAGFARHLAQVLDRPGPDDPLILNREFETARLWSRANPSVVIDQEPTATHRPDR